MNGKLTVGDVIEVQTEAGALRGELLAIGAMLRVLDHADGCEVRLDATLPVRIVRSNAPATAPAPAPKSAKPSYVVRLYTFTGALDAVHEVSSRRAAVRAIAAHGGIRYGEIVDDAGRVERIDGGRAIEESEGVKHFPVWRDTRSTYNGIKVRGSRTWYGSRAA